MSKEKGEVIGRFSAEDTPASHQNRTLRDLAGAGGQKVSAAVPPPPPAKFNLDVPDIPARKITIPLSEEERKVRSEQFRMHADKIAAQMQDSVAWIWWYKQLSADEQPLYQAECAAIKGDVKKMLSYKDTAYRNVSLIAFSDAIIKNCPEFREWFKITLEELVEVGFLVQLTGDLTNGPKFYGEFYGLHELFDKNDSARKVLNSLKNLYERTLETEHRIRESRQKELIAEAGQQISLAELKEKKVGKIILPVPDMKKEANRYSFLVKSDGERIFAVRALGGIERVVSEMAEAGASVPVDSLSLQDAGLRGKAGTLHSILRRTIQVADREEKEKIRVAEQKAKVVADFQKRTEDLRARQEADRQNLGPKATLNDQEFLVDRKVGIWFMDFGTRPFFEKFFNKETNRKEDRKVHGLMALLERDEFSKVRVIDGPVALQEFFVGHREFVAEGDCFYGLGKLGYAIREVEKRLGISQSNGNGKEKIPSSEVSNQEVQAQTEAMQMAAGTGEDISDAVIPSVPEPEEKEEAKPKPKKKASKKRLPGDN